KCLLLNYEAKWQLRPCLAQTAYLPFDGHTPLCCAVCLVIMNSSIVVDGWYRNVFDPQTKSRAKGRPRLLINDGFGPHESLEVMQFCHENSIILARLPSYTSHKLQ